MVLDILRDHPLPRMELTDRAVYIANLHFIRALVVASEPLLEIVIPRSTGELRAYYERHLEEERGHLAMFDADLKSLMEIPALDWMAARIAGSQYYLAHHASPDLLLGYMAALECRPMPMADAELLARTHGEYATRGIRHHAKHDPAHGIALIEQIERSPHKADILTNLTYTAPMLAIALRGIAHGFRSSER